MTPAVHDLLSYLADAGFPYSPRVIGIDGPGEVVCHGDFGPWNIVWDGIRPVGLLDWEYANLAPPIQDVAYALEYMAPRSSEHGARAAETQLASAQAA